MRRLRGFTLLETLLAVATAAALIGLVAAAMAQTRRWTLERTPAIRALWLTHVRALLVDQLRSAAAVGQAAEAAKAPTATLDARSLRLHTGLSALHDRAAIVEAVWRIGLGDRSLLVGGAQRQTAWLELEERVVRSPAQPAERVADPQSAQEDVRVRRLLDDCEELGWWTLDSAREKRPPSDGQGADALPARLWRPLTEEDGAQAVRVAQLRGRCDGEEFEWTVRVEASPWF